MNDAKPIGDTKTVEYTKTIKLKRPVTHGQETYTELNLKEPTAAQVIKAQKDGAANGPLACAILLIAEVCAIPKAAVERVGISDIMDAEGFLGRFMTAPTLPAP